MFNTTIVEVNGVWPGRRDSMLSHYPVTFHPPFGIDNFGVGSDHFPDQPGAEVAVQVDDRVEVKLIQL